MTRGVQLVRAVLAAASVVATVTGTLVAVRGAAAIPSGAPAAASNDSVMRFYAVWWASQGSSLWRLSRDPDLPQAQLQAVCTTTPSSAAWPGSRPRGRPDGLIPCS